MCSGVVMVYWDAEDDAVVMLVWVQYYNPLFHRAKRMTSPNYMLYSNQMASFPDGDTIENIHRM